MAVLTSIYSRDSRTSLASFSISSLLKSCPFTETQSRAIIVKNNTDQWYNIVTLFRIGRTNQQSSAISYGNGIVCKCSCAAKEWTVSRRFLAGQHVFKPRRMVQIVGGMNGTFDFVVGGRSLERARTRRKGILDHSSGC
ncbi:hypothetical protein GWI33_005252 [Rhynchophorus ferrugineus]|uniref:Uncharacterized protein n=1 Tax=Rhynchophorus ferrugineus TaxID=354439 RepID=A0A834IHR6_RHYFE|nr:hypothetical protein GWI33_005252 [Rhynchophorus ferrugineus]